MRQKIAVIAIVAAIGVAMATLQVRTQQQQAPLKIDKVKEGLYVISESGGNVGVRVTNEGVILIDDKFERNYAEIMQNVKNVTNQPVKYVINTHQHGDHTGGNVQFIKTAEIIAHKNARANMIQSKQADTPPRITYTDQTAVHLGGAEVQAHYFGRGHTSGDSIIYFPDLRTVHMGDLFTNGLPFIDYDNGGSAGEWSRTIDGALKLDFDTAIPGHGPVMTKADLQKHRDKIQTLVSRTKDLIKKGTTQDQLATQLKVDDLGWTVAGLFVQRSIPGFYKEVSAMK